MFLLLVIVVCGTTTAAAVIYSVLLAQALSTRIWLPGFVGLVAAGLTLIFAHNISMPSPIRIVFLPVIVASIAACVSVRRHEWKAIISGELTCSTSQAVCIICFCVVFAVGGVYSGVGKPLLVSLDQDVIGSTASERREIAVAGAAFAALLGGIVGTMAVSRFLAPRPKCR